MLQLNALFLLTAADTTSALLGLQRSGATGSAKEIPAFLQSQTFGRLSVNVRAARVLPDQPAVPR